MLYLKVTNLAKSYTSKILVDHVDFTISRWQKIALVAKNWAWKSTLLKVLMKEIDLSDGSIDRREWVSIWYLSQDTRLDDTMTVREFLFDFDTMQHREQEVELNIAINKLRINFIVEKLKSDPNFINYKISYLAETSGFSSHSTFATIFKSIKFKVSESIFWCIQKKFELELKWSMLCIWKNVFFNTINTLIFLIKNEQFKNNICFRILLWIF